MFFEPKTARSRRTITMPPPIARSLRIHMKRQLQERWTLNGACQSEKWAGLVFTDETGNPLTGFHVSRRFKKLLGLADLPIMRYHDLRHGAASLMAAQNVSPRVAMEILGHAQISTTMNIYTHVATEMQKEAAEKVAGALWQENGDGLVSIMVSN